MPSEPEGGMSSRTRNKGCIALLILLMCPLGASAQTWRWSYESVDTVSARFTSTAVDHEGNVHVAYAGDGGSSLKYAFRAATGNRWFTMLLDNKLQDFATNLTLDPKGNPQICYTPRELKFAHFDGGKWKIEPIAAGEGSIEYNCSILVGSDGTPRVLWYHTRLANGDNYYHLKHAVLKDGVWAARTVDFDGEDGKWNSMILDSQGNPHLVYSAFPSGVLRSNYWNGTSWIPQTGIPAADRTLAAGMWNSLVLGPQNQLEVSYYEGPVEFNGSHSQTLIKFARQNGSAWSVETVDSVVQRGGWVGYRSTLLLDKGGFPHICYEDGGVLKHAYSDGKRWHIQVVVPRGAEPYLYSSMAIGPDDTLYISYRDASDGSLRVAIGRSESAISSSTSVEQSK